MKGFLLILGVMLYVRSIHLEQMRKTKNDVKPKVNKELTEHDKTKEHIDYAYFAIHIDYSEKYKKPFEHGTLITTFKKNKEKWVCYDITYDNKDWDLEITTNKDERCLKKLSFNPIKVKIDKKLLVSNIESDYFNEYKNSVSKDYQYNSIEEGKEGVSDYKQNLDPKKANCLTFLLFCAKKIDKSLVLYKQIEETILNKANALIKLMEEKKSKEII